MSHLIYNPQAITEFFALQGLTTKVQQRKYLASLSDELRCTDKTFNNWFVQGNIRLDRLLLFCRLARYHLNYFAMYEGTDNSAAARDYRIESPEQWAQLVPPHVRTDFLFSGLTSRLDMQVTDIVRTFGLKDYIKEFEDNKPEVLSHMTIRQLFAMMDHPDLEPWEYMRDEGEPFPPSPDTVAIASEGHRPLATMDILRHENATLQLSLDALQSDNEELQERIRLLEKLLESRNATIATQEDTIRLQADDMQNKELRCQQQAVQIRELQQKINEQHIYRSKRLKG